MSIKTLSLSIALLLVFSFPVMADVGVSKLVPAKYQTKPIVANMVYYVDRTFTITSFPDELKGAIMIMTGNDDKASKGAGFVTFNIDQSATVYIAHDSRGETAKGGVSPDWLTKDFTFVNGKVIEVSDTNMGTFNLWKKDFGAGPVSLGGNADPPAAGQGSMYLVLLTPPKLASVKSLGKVATKWAEIKN
ncbi:MAG: hypothetical protein AAB116_15555 [Candidatus Poribacteria bacterium]